MSQPALILYTRGYCHLCHDMQAQIESYSPQYRFTLELRDVDSNPLWLSAYDELVPVLVRRDQQGQEQEICHYHLDHAALIAQISA